MCQIKEWSNLHFNTLTINLVEKRQYQRQQYVCRSKSNYFYANDVNAGAFIQRHSISLIKLLLLLSIAHFIFTNLFFFLPKYQPTLVLSYAIFCLLPCCCVALSFLPVACQHPVLFCVLQGPGMTLPPMPHTLPHTYHPPHFVMVSCAILYFFSFLMLFRIRVFNPSPNAPRLMLQALLHCFKGL